LGRAHFWHKKSGLVGLIGLGFDLQTHGANLPPIIQMTNGTSDRMHIAFRLEHNSGNLQCWRGFDYCINLCHSCVKIFARRKITNEFDSPIVSKMTMRKCDETGILFARISGRENSIFPG
jgi:hypothetical protein